MWHEVHICGQSRTLFGVSWALKLLWSGMMRMRRQDWQQGTRSPPSPPPTFMNFCFSHDFLHFLVRFIQKGKRRMAPAETYCMAWIWTCQGQEGWSTVKPLKPRVAQCTTALSSSQCAEQPGMWSGIHWCTSFPISLASSGKSKLPEYARVWRWLFSCVFLEEKFFLHHAGQGWREINVVDKRTCHAE